MIERNNFKKMKAVTRVNTESFLVSPLKVKRQSALLLILKSINYNINLSVRRIIK